MQLCAQVQPILTAPLTINTSAVLCPTPYTTRDALAFITTITLCFLYDVVLLLLFLPHRGRGSTGATGA